MKAGTVKIIITYLVLFSAAILLLQNKTVAEGGNASSSVSNASSSTKSLTREELASQIEDRTKKLDEINKEIEQTKQNLQDAQSKKTTLQRELGILSGNINQLSLGIKGDELSIQKLALEIESLNYDLEDIKTSVTDRKAAIVKSIIEMQKNDYRIKNVLYIFLGHESLAEGFSEEQSLADLQGQLATDIKNLVALKDVYGRKIAETNGKKQQIVYHRSDLEQRKFIIEDQKSERQNLFTKTKNQENAFQKQITELSQLQKQIATEVEALGAILRTKIDPSTLPPLGSGVLATPINTSKGGITQDYGATDFAKYGYKGKWHNGVDIAAILGTPILAAEDGAVAATGDQDKYCYRGAYGKFIVINHNNNLTTLYAHLSRISVNKGDAVKRGQVIGYSGQSGYATGPHLHFTVFAKETFYIGPSKVCGPMPFGGDLNPMGYL